VTVKKLSNCKSSIMGSTLDTPLRVFLPHCSSLGQRLPTISKDKWENVLTEYLQIGPERVPKIFAGDRNLKRGT
jgi:hypothetical protein